MTDRYLTRAGSHAFIVNPHISQMPIEDALRQGIVRLGRDRHFVLPSGERHDMSYVYLRPHPISGSVVELVSHDEAERWAAAAGVEIAKENSRSYETVSHPVAEPIAMSLSHFNRLPILEHLKHGEAKEGWWARSASNFDSIFILYGEEWVEKAIDFPEAA
jgi:hypothetical protein